jgi:hypothetical protein
VDAERLIRSALLSGVIFEEQAAKLREITIAHDQDHPPTAEMRAEWEARRKLLEAQSVRYTQERDVEMITRAQRELDWFRGEVSAFLSTTLRELRAGRRLTIAELRGFAREYDLKLEDQ